MKTTKKNILFSIVFLLGLLLSLFVASWVFQPKRNIESYGMEDWRANGILAEPAGTIDVLFLGDSVSYCSINPIQIWRDHGITSYVCATSEQKLYYSKEFLNKAFEKQSPKIVMLGTSAIYTQFTYKDEIRNKAEQILPLVRYHDRWKNPDTFKVLMTDLKIDYSYQVNDKGYYLSGGRQQVDVGDYKRPTDEMEGILDICKTNVVDIKEFCEANNAKFILLSEPNATTAWTPARHNTMAQLAEELGVEYIDLNYMSDEVPIHWSEDSFDQGEHLNYWGAQKVSTYLGKYLAETELFEDKRDDVTYDAWNAAQIEFYEKVETWN